MKKTNVLLLALLAFVCLFAVSCDGEPASPANPANPGKPDDQPVTPPSETSVIDPVKDQGVSACLRVMDFFTELDFEDIGNDETKFLSLFEDEDWKESLLELCFAKEGKVDFLGDDTYLEINGERYYMPHSGHDEQEITDFSIENLDVSSVSFDLNEAEGTMSISVEDLTFKAKIIASVEHSIEIKMSANAFFPVEKYKYTNSETGEAYEYWVCSYGGTYIFDITMDGAQWPHFEFKPLEVLAYYGDYERFLGYTVSFDSNGGSFVNSIKVPFGESISSDDLPKPTKQGFVFMGWVTEDDDFIDEYGVDVEKDMKLRAVYYAPAPSCLEGEIYATYKLSDYFSFITHGGVSSFGNLFEEEVDSDETLLDIAFLVNGKTSGFGKEAVITIGEEEYTSAMVKSKFAWGISNGNLVSKTSLNELKSEEDSEVVGKTRFFEGLSYTVTIKSKEDDSIVETLDVSLSFGRVDVKPCWDPAYLEVAVDIDDGSTDLVQRWVKLIKGDSNGYYSNDDGDYYFDSTKYPKIELKK